MTRENIGRKMMVVGLCFLFLGLILLPATAMLPASVNYEPIALCWLCWTGALTLGGMFVRGW